MKEARTIERPPARPKDRWEELGVDDAKRTRARLLVSWFRELVAGWLRDGAEGVSWLARELRAMAPSSGPDRLLCGVVLALTGFGVVMVFSAGAVFAAKTYGDWTYFLKREAIYGTLGLAAFAFAVRTDYAVYRKLTYPILFLSIALLIAVVFFGTRVNGAVRWLRFGPVSFQPSELAKFALILYLSVLLARKADKVKDFSIGFLPSLMMTGVFLALLLVKQKDLGTAAVMGLTALALLFVAGTRTSYILLTVLAAAPVVWKVLILGEKYRTDRLLAFLNPWASRRDTGYQLFESLISVGSGGVLGQGLGESRQKLFFLPEAHTDFILAIVGEELGLVGILSVVVAFGVLVWRGVLAALRARDPFGSYLAFGLTFLFGLQALVNMNVALGLVPTKGLPLPFISYGGTALVMNLFMAGVLANVSAKNPEPRELRFFEALRFRGVRAKNRKAEPAVKVVVLPPGRRPPAHALTPEG